jgi:AcrR family transcriptional regulator
MGLFFPSPGEWTDWSGGVFVSVEPGEGRASILNAARRIFAERGYDGTSVDSIVRSAGVSKGAFYWHFESKGALFRELLRQQTDRILDFYALKGEERDGDATALLVRKGEEFMRLLSSDRISLLLWTHLAMEAQRGNQELRRMASEINHTIKRELVPLVRERFAAFRDEKRRPCFSPEELIVLLHTFFDGFLVNYSVTGDFEEFQGLWRRMVHRLIEGGESYAA